MKGTGENRKVAEGASTRETLRQKDRTRTGL